MSFTTVWLHILKTFLRLSFIYLFGAILVAKLKDPWDRDFSLSYSYFCVSYIESDTQ